MGSRRQFTPEFKLAAVRRLEQGVPIAEVARGLEVNPNVLHRWRREFRQGPGNAFPGNGKHRWSEGRIAELERNIGQQSLHDEGARGEEHRRPTWIGRWGYQDFARFEVRADRV